MDERDEVFPEFVNLKEYKEQRKTSKKYLGSNKKIPSVMLPENRTGYREGDWKSNWPRWVALSILFGLLALYLGSAFWIGQNQKVHFVNGTATGNVDVITVDHMRAMKDRAIVCNIGHFDSEIQIAALDNYKWTEVKPGTDLVEFPDGKQIIILAKGRLVNLGCATGHPSFVMSSSFTNQTLAQIELFTKNDQYENHVYVLPKHLDEKVAALHLEKLGVKLTRLSKKQADYIGVSAEGPFKPEHYRY